MLENTCVSAEAIDQLLNVRSVYACMQRESWEIVDSMDQMKTAQEVVDHLDAYEAHETQRKLCFKVLLGCDAEIAYALLQHGEEYFDVLNAFERECQEWHSNALER